MDREYNLVIPIVMISAAFMVLLTIGIGAYTIFQWEAQQCHPIPDEGIENVCEIFD